MFIFGYLIGAAIIGSIGFLISFVIDAVTPTMPQIKPRRNKGQQSAY